MSRGRAAESLPLGLGEDEPESLPALELEPDGVSVPLRRRQRKPPGPPPEPELEWWGKRWVWGRDVKRPPIYPSHPAERGEWSPVMVGRFLRSLRGNPPSEGA